MLCLRVVFVCLCVCMCVVCVCMQMVLSFVCAFSSEIWEKFVEFEANVGDLSSLVKVEKRRTATIKSEVYKTKPPDSMQHSLIRDTP